jgi:hypothetical protein
VSVGHAANGIIGSFGPGWLIRSCTFSCAKICAWFAACCPTCPAKLPPTIDLPGAGDLLVAARVIGMHVRVDDVANRLVAGDLPDLGEELVGEWLDERIDNQHAFITDLDRCVDEPGIDHPDLTLHVQRADLDVVEVLLRAALPTRRCGTALTSLRRRGTACTALLCATGGSHEQRDGHRAHHAKCAR